MDDVLRLLRAAGHRVSAPARVVLEALFAADAPVSAEDIAGMSDLELDVSSVYRNLERLQQLGVVSHIHPGHGPGLYSIVRGQDQEYLACDRCHRLTPLQPQQLDPIRDQLRERFGHRAAFSHFPIHGVCAECAAITNGNDVSEGAHRHDEPHSHTHRHGDVEHSHAHSTHDHDHIEHEHEHRHGDVVHAHPHVHQEGLQDVHEHDHQD